MTLTDILRDEILSGRLPPGAVLLQTELAARHGVSRIPVRDALQRLAAERLVTVIPGKGAQVIALSPAELAEVFDLRILLEVDLIHRAAQAVTPAARAEAEHALRRSDLEAGHAGWRQGDWAFHCALYAPAGRPRHLALIAELRDTCAIHTAQYDRLVSNTDQWLADHQAMFNAWSRGQAAVAAGLLTQHLTAARDHLLAQMPDQRPVQTGSRFSAKARAPSS